MKYLRPHKLKPFNQDILFVSKLILDHLKNTKESEEKVSTLLSAIKKKYKVKDKIFVFGLNFLFIVNKIEYIKDSDKVVIV